MSKNTKEQEIPYSYLVDNIKIFLIFLVVFNHIIAFQLVKADQVVRFVWYGISYAGVHIYFRLSVQEASGCDEEC